MVRYVDNPRGVLSVHITVGLLAVPFVKLDLGSAPLSLVAETAHQTKCATVIERFDMRQLIKKIKLIATLVVGVFALVANAEMTDYGEISGACEIVDTSSGTAIVFKESGTFVPSLNLSVNGYLVVGGGGSGGWTLGGGGGGGAVVEKLDAEIPLAAGTTVTLEVGAGGGNNAGVEAGSNGHWKQGQNGGTSRLAFDSAEISAEGGGYGGGWDTGYKKGGDGGCGGGGCQANAGGSGNPGYNGGWAVNPQNAAGGGGGMGGPGVASTTGNPGSGGPGVVSYITGTGVEYGAGGGGGGAVANGFNCAAGGAAGGPSAGAGQILAHGGDAPANRGGGGGGGGWNGSDGYRGGYGGSGVIVLLVNDLSSDDPKGAILEVRGASSTTMRLVYAVTTLGSCPSVTVSAVISRDMQFTTAVTNVIETLTSVPGQSREVVLLGLEPESRYWVKLVVGGESPGGFRQRQSIAVAFRTGNDIGVFDGVFQEIETDEGQVFLFTGDSQVEFTTEVNLQRFLVVGGGGAGGWTLGGGGAGGEVIEVKDAPQRMCPGDRLTITVGAGGGNRSGLISSGTTSAWRSGSAGESTTMTIITSTGSVDVVALGGGGGGGWMDSKGGAGPNSGGGSNGAAAGNCESLTGFPGGTAVGNGPGGGGGGAGGAGSNASSTLPGAGGAGILSDITGESLDYGAGGGAGGSRADNFRCTQPGAAGGTSAGGGSLDGAGAAGAANRGGGGGGGGYDTSRIGYTGGNGGAGAVIICLVGDGPRVHYPRAATPTFSNRGYESVTVNWSLLSVGDADEVTATLEIADNSDMANSATHALGTLTAADVGLAQATDLDGLDFGGRYYVRITLAGEAGGAPFVRRSGIGEVALRRRTVSVLGDSFSTFAGQPNCGNPYYGAGGTSGTTLLTSVDQTWWMQAINAIGGELVSDSAVGGSRMTDLGTGSGFGYQASKLGDAEIIFIMGGMNDSWGGVSDRATLETNVGYVFNYVRGNHPEADVYVVLHVLGPKPGISEVVREVQRELALKFGFTVVDCEDGGAVLAEMNAAGKDHPMATVMTNYANRVVAAFTANQERRAAPSATGACEVATTSDADFTCVTNAANYELRFTRAGSYTLTPSQNLLVERVVLTGGAGASGWHSGSPDSGASGACVTNDPELAILKQGVPVAFTVGAGGQPTYSAAWRSASSADWTAGGAGGETQVNWANLLVASAAGGNGGAPNVSGNGWAGESGRDGSIVLVVSPVSDEISASFLVTPGTDAATLYARLAFPGVDASTVTAAYGVRLKSAGPAETVPLTPIAGEWTSRTEWTLERENLIPGQTYFARLRLENDQGAAFERTVEFTTLSEAEATGTPGEFTFDGAVETLDVEGGRFAIRFSESGELTVTKRMVCDRMLLVGGGGAGGWTIGGGGGGGGVVQVDETFTIEPGVYSITIGAGGDPHEKAGAWVNGGDGEPTSVVLGDREFVALGGGGGAAWDTSTGISQSGVSSGGGAASCTTGYAGRTTGKGTEGQGYDGGAISGNSPGGGGGAGECGHSGDSTYAGRGGEGMTNAITGVAEVYGSGGGGGGGQGGNQPAHGASGGTNGGSGSDGNPNTAASLATPGRDGYGAGGGGGGYSTSLAGNSRGGIFGAAGGKGVVIFGGSAGAAFEVKSSSWLAASRRLSAVFARRSAEGDAAVVCRWKAGEYLTDLAAWETLDASCAFVDGTTTVTGEFTVPAEAEYLVFTCGENRSGVIVVGELKDDSASPLGTVVSATPNETTGAVDFGYELTSLPDTCSLEVSAAEDGLKGRAYTFVLSGLELGSGTVSLAELNPDRTYRFTFRLLGEQGETVLSDALTATAPSTATAANANAYFADAPEIAHLDGDAVSFAGALTRTAEALAEIWLDVSVQPGFALCTSVCVGSDGFADGVPLAAVGETQPGMVYYARWRGVDADGRTLDLSPTRPFTTPSGSTVKYVSSAFDTDGFIVVTYQVSAGAGETRLTFKDQNAVVETVALTVDAGVTNIVFRSPVSSNQSRTWSVDIAQKCAGKDLIYTLDGARQQTYATYDTAVYTWKGGDGAWNDAAKWDCSKPGVPASVGYPTRYQRGYGATAVFSAGTTGVVTFAASAAASKLRFDPETDVTFRGASAGILLTGNMDRADDAFTRRRFTLDAMSWNCDDAVGTTWDNMSAVSRDFEFALVNGAALSLDRIYLLGEADGSNNRLYVGRGSTLNVGGDFAYRQCDVVVEDGTVNATPRGLYPGYGKKATTDERLILVGAAKLNIGLFGEIDSSGAADKRTAVVFRPTSETPLEPVVQQVRPLYSYAFGRHYDNKTLLVTDFTVDPSALTVGCTWEGDFVKWASGFEKGMITLDEGLAYGADDQSIRARVVGTKVPETFDALVEQPSPFAAILRVVLGNVGAGGYRATFELETESGEIAVCKRHTLVAGENWEFRLGSLPAGDYRWRVTVTDPSGNGYGPVRTGSFAIASEYYGGGTARRVRYIKSDGTAYIRTGILPKRTLSVAGELRFEKSAIGTTDGWLTYFGHYTGQGDGYCIYANNDSICYNRPGSTRQSGLTLIDGEFYVFEGDGTGWTVGGKTAAISESSWNVASGTDCDLPLFAFCQKYNGSMRYYTANSKATICSFQIRDAGDLVRDFVAAVDDEGVACMFDRVEHKFYYNAAEGGAFIASDELVADAAFDHFAFRDVKLNGNRLTAQVHYPPMADATTAVLYLGAAYHGEDADAWATEECRELAVEFPAGETGGEIGIVLDDVLSDRHYLRLKTADGQWSSTIYLPATRIKHGLVISIR